MVAGKFGFCFAVNCWSVEYVLDVNFCLRRMRRDNGLLDFSLVVVERYMLVVKNFQYGVVLRKKYEDEQNMVAGME